MLTGTGMVFGSPSFMSPEQARGLRVGPASDVFSLGAVLTFAATGQGPFGSGSSATLLYRVVFTPPDTSGLATELRPLVERCLAKDPEQRPTTHQLLAELDTAPRQQAGCQRRPPRRSRHSPIRTRPSRAHGCRRPAARAGDSVASRAPRTRTGRPDADADLGGHSPACNRRDRDTRRPGRRAAGPLPPGTRRRRCGRLTHGPLSHCGHDRAPASIQ